MKLLRRRKTPPTSETDAWLIVGLGNPGDQYSQTPHNAGARAVEHLAERFSSRLRSSKAKALVAEVRDGETRLILGRPATYMNESGDGVASLLAYYKVDPDRLIVVHDDIDLKLGALKLKFGGGSAGNHGIEDIERKLATPDFLRVRIGVGRGGSPRQDPADYLISPMSKKVSEELTFTERVAADAALALISDGLDQAMNRFNTG
jgi:PTH1 family peptidyl-tRNA hydrolase